MLAARERRRMRGTWDVESDPTWLDTMGGGLEEWQMPAQLSLLPANIWTQHHRAGHNPPRAGPGSRADRQEEPRQGGGVRAAPARSRRQVPLHRLERRSRPDRD